MIRKWIEKNIYASLTKKSWLFIAVAAPLSLIYRVAYAVRENIVLKVLRRPRRVIAPVISVGNIALGGMGKTPFVIALAARMRKIGFNPVILSRGYGSCFGQKLNSDFQPMYWLEKGEVKARTSEVKQIADECLQISQAQPCPVVIGADRWQCANWYYSSLPGGESESSKTVFLLDDGMQQRSLQVDYHFICFKKSVFDLRNLYLLPLGPLRQLLTWVDMPCSYVLEGMQSSVEGELFINALGSKAEPEQIVVTKFELEGWSTADEKETGDFDHPLLKDYSWVAIAGIAFPEDFFGKLERIGVPIAHKVALADHEPINADRISSELNKSRAKAPIGILTTQKDYCRDQAFWKNLPEKVIICRGSTLLPNSIPIEETLKKIQKTKNLNRL